MVFVTYIVLLLQAVLFAQYPHCKRSPPDANRNDGQRPQKHPFANGIFHCLTNKGATRTHISINHDQASWAHDHLFSFKGAENIGIRSLQFPCRLFQSFDCIFAKKHPDKPNPWNLKAQIHSSLKNPIHLGTCRYGSAQVTIWRPSPGNL